MISSHIYLNFFPMVEGSVKANMPRAQGSHHGTLSSLTYKVISWQASKFFCDCEKKDPGPVNISQIFKLSL